MLKTVNGKILKSSNIQNANIVGRRLKWNTLVDSKIDTRWNESKQDRLCYLQGVPKKIFLKLIFEFLTLGWVFLGVIFHEKTFLFYKIFWVSKQNFEKMAPIWWNISKNITSIWLIQFPKSVKCFKKSFYQFLMINLSKIIDFNDILTYFTSFWSLKNDIEAIFVTVFY